MDPLLAVRALLVYLAVQFIENQFIYPRVVGKSVGLSPLYTLVAAMIGGKLFGILFFIPLTAVVLELVKEDACRRLRTKAFAARLGLSAPAPAPELPLTDRDRELARLVAGRCTNKEIAAALYLSEGTVKQYINQLYAKLDMGGDPRTRRARLAEWYQKNAPRN
mgnify:CR=1 FL=1